MLKNRTCHDKFSFWPFLLVCAAELTCRGSDLSSDTRYIRTPDLLSSSKRYCSGMSQLLL